RRVVDLHAGQPQRKIVDHVVPPQLPVGHDVDPGHLLILDRRLDGQVMDLVQVMAADPPLEVVVLDALEPPGHRVTTDDSSRQQRHAHGITPTSYLRTCRVTRVPASRFDLRLDGSPGPPADKAPAGAPTPRPGRHAPSPHA